MRSEHRTKRFEWLQMTGDPSRSQMVSDQRCNVEIAGLAVDQDDNVFARAGVAVCPLRVPVFHLLFRRIGRRRFDGLTF